MNQIINHQRRFRVKSGIRLITKQVFRLQGNGTRYSHTLLHASADFTGIF